MRPEHHEKGVESGGRARSADPLSRLLLAGLVIAIGLMIAGALLAVVRGSGSVQKVSSIGRLPQLLASGDPTGFLDLGLLVLLATPFARAVALCAGFVRRRRWLFAGISMAVVAVLVLSGLLGLL